MRRVVITITAEVVGALVLSLLLSGALFCLFLAFFAVVNGTDRFASWRQSVTSARYELLPATQGSSRVTDLLAAVRPLVAKSSVEQTQKGFRLTITGVEDLDAAGEAIRDSGFTFKQVSLYLDIRAAGDSFLRSSTLFGLLLVFQSACFAGVGWFIAKRRKLLDSGPRLRAVWAGLAVGLLAAAVAFVTERGLEKVGFPVQEQPWVYSALTSGLPQSLFFGVLIVIIAPVAEEMFFRGYVFRAFRQQVRSRWVAYGVSALLFAAVHLNPTATVIYVLYGVLLAFVLDKTGALLSAIVAHSLINVFGVLTVLYR